MSRYPKPDAEKRNRSPLVFGWTQLPDRSDAVAPPLPDWRDWDRRTLAWWASMWRKPQSAQWDPDGTTLFFAAVLVNEIITGSVPTSRVMPELRALLDRHGLSGAKSLLQLRWKLPADTPAELPDGAGDLLIEEALAALLEAGR